MKCRKRVITRRLAEARIPNIDDENGRIFLMNALTSMLDRYKRLRVIEFALQN